MRNLKRCWDNWWPATPLIFSFFLGLPCVCAVASHGSLCLPQRLMLQSCSLVGNSTLMRLALASVKSWSCGVGPVPTGSELKPPPEQFLPIDTFSVLQSIPLPWQLVEAPTVCAVSHPCVVTLTMMSVVRLRGCCPGMEFTWFLSCRLEADCAFVGTPASPSQGLRLLRLHIT